MRRQELVVESVGPCRVGALAATEVAWVADGDADLGYAWEFSERDSKGGSRVRW